MLLNDINFVYKGWQLSFEAFFNKNAIFLFYFILFKS